MRSIQRGAVQGAGNYGTGPGVADKASACVGNAWGQACRVVNARTVDRTLVDGVVVDTRPGLADALLLTFLGGIVQVSAVDGTSN